MAKPPSSDRKVAQYLVDGCSDHGCSSTCLHSPCESGGRCWFGLPFSCPRSVGAGRSWPWRFLQVRLFVCLLLLYALLVVLWCYKRD